MQILQGKAFPAGEIDIVSVLRQSVLGTCTEQWLKHRNTTRGRRCGQREKGTISSWGPDTTVRVLALL